MSSALTTCMAVHSPLGFRDLRELQRGNISDAARNELQRLLPEVAGLRAHFVAALLEGRISEWPRGLVRLCGAELQAALACKEDALRAALRPWQIWPEAVFSCALMEGGLPPGITAFLCHPAYFFGCFSENRDSWSRLATQLWFFAASQQQRYCLARYWALLRGEQSQDAEYVQRCLRCEDGALLGQALELA